VVNERLRYFVKKPGKTRKTFGIVAYYLEGRQKKYSDLPENLAVSLTSINENFLKAIYDVSEAAVLVQELIDKEYKRHGIQRAVLRDSFLSEANSKVFDSYWADEYSSRFLEDEQAMRLKLRKALRLIEPCSIQTSTQSELVVALKKQSKNNGEIRYACDRLNQLLKYLKRDFRLKKPREEIHKVIFITEQELKTITRAMDVPVLVDFAWVLFSTGVRLSEAIALEPSDLIDSDRLAITKQFPKNQKEKPPKSGKTGTVIVAPMGQKSLVRWLALSRQEKVNCRYALYDALEKACLSVKLGRNINPHALRHSHAIYLLERGATLAEVSLQLRNTISVCQKYYIGFEHTAGTLDRLKTLFKNKKSKTKPKAG
jgi:integrase